MAGGTRALPAAAALVQELQSCSAPQGPPFHASSSVSRGGSATCTLGMGFCQLFISKSIRRWCQGSANRICRPSRPRTRHLTPLSWEGGQALPGVGGGARSSIAEAGGAGQRAAGCWVCRRKLLAGRPRAESASLSPSCSTTVAKRLGVNIKVMAQAEQVACGARGPGSVPERGGIGEGRAQLCHTRRMR